MDVRVGGGIGEHDAAAWDALLPANAPPFLRHTFLSALESTGCVGDETGWIPRPLTVFDGDQMIGAAPAYLKAHSMGEFVYDWGWAEASENAGLSYYPKLVIAVPFTPVAGPRLLVHPDLDPATRKTVQEALVRGAQEFSARTGCSGTHILFCTDDERALCEDMGFTHRLGVQYQWRDEGYADFDAFLGRFKSKQRKNIRRERRGVQEAGIRVRTLVGDAVTDDLMAPLFRFYCHTIDKFYYGRRYLNLDMFRVLWTQMRPWLHIVVAENADGVPVAGALSLTDGVHCYGRYWGTDDAYPFLHFEVCAYSPIEDGIGRGIRVLEAGAGGGSHKLGRGFMPTFTHSVHHLRHPGLARAIQSFCAEEADVLRANAAIEAEGVFIRDAPQPVTTSAKDG